MAEVIRRRCDDVPGFDVLGADSPVLAPLVVGVVARVMGAGAVPIGESTVEVIHRPTGTAFAMPSGVARSSSSGSSGASGISEWKSRSRRFTGSVSTGFVSSVRGGGRGSAVRLLVVRLLSDRVSGFVSGRHGVFGVLFPGGRVFHVVPAASGLGLGAPPDGSGFRPETVPFGDWGRVRGCPQGARAVRGRSSSFLRGRKYDAVCVRDWMLPNRKLR